ncbi:MAG: phosphoribosylamine--glycine ligase [Actinomycetaceae bacterium]|nr:phosphoribosylamine--glycine ligase [Actinomycetaceae bacterium]
MKVLLVGNGGREHALARALIRTSDSTHPVELIAQAGNPGIDALGTPVPFDPMDAAAVAEVATTHAVDLVVVGPEAPLAAGVANAVRAVGIPCFGPDRDAARLESSKSFAKEVMNEAGVATARAFTCRTMAEVDAALDDLGAPHVVKDDALAAGKGVLVTVDRAAARAHAEECLAQPRDAAFGAENAVVIEDHLDGPEVSLFCLSDGTSVVPLVPAQDFKRLLDNNEGPNTGGMGAYSPLPWLRESLVQEVVDTVALPTVREMARRGTPFIGLLYCGLAMTSRGVRVVEFNVRFGDPETQVVLERLDSPLAPLLYAAATGTLESQPEPQWSQDAAVTVVMASEGYPGTLRTGEEITGIEAAEDIPGVHVIYAGAKVVTPANTEAAAGNCCGAENDPVLVNSGGRVLDVTARAKDVEAARQVAYQAVERIRFSGAQYRTDIATWPHGLQA